MIDKRLNFLYTRYNRAFQEIGRRPTKAQNLTKVAKIWTGMARYHKSTGRALSKTKKLLRLLQKGQEVESGEKPNEKRFSEVAIEESPKSKG